MHERRRLLACNFNLRLAVTGWMYGLVILFAAGGQPGCVFDQSGLRSGEPGNNNNNEVTAVCGDDVQETPELCDGADLAGETCLSQGYDGGSLACLGDCTGLDTTQCTGTGPVCGDGLREGAEACDGTDLAGSCQSEGFYVGALACLGDCTGYDTSGCSGVCGDDTVNGTEVCDGSDLGVRTCADEGYYGGTLACVANCTGFVTSGCSGTCGDNTINGTEECDGARLGGTTCAGLGCRSGTVSCNPDCTLNTLGCYANHDEDGDGVDDNCDNCPTYGNAGQANGDSDEVGNVCEASWNAGLLSEITAFESLMSTANWSATSGGTWTAGTDEVVGARTGTGTNYLYSTNLPNVNYSVETRFDNSSGPTTGNRYTALVFAWGYVGPSLWSYECVYNRDNDHVGFWRAEGGSWNYIDGVTVSTSVTAGQWKRLRATRYGDTLRCAYEDATGAGDHVVISGGDVWNDMSGRTGLRVYNETTTFTSFVIYR